MTFLGLNTTEDENEAKTSPTLRQELFRRMLLGGGTASGVALAYGAFELLHQQPAEGFKLLENWGPRFLLWLVGMYLGWDIVRQLIACFWRLVKAMEGVSSSMHTIASKDDIKQRESELLLDHLNSQVGRAVTESQELKATFLDESRKIQEIITSQALITNTLVRGGTR